LHRISGMATIALPLRRVFIARTGTAIPLIVGLTGTLLSWFGSGWDVSWHRLFGRDTFWSTPHLFIYVGVALWGVAALIASATAMAGRPIRGRALVLGPLRAELGLALIGVGALVSTLVPAALAIATVALPGRWAATWAALAYTVIALLGYEMLAASGWRPPAFPPVVIAGAIAIDVVRARKGRWSHPLALGFAFT